MKRPGYWVVGWMLAVTLLLTCFPSAKLRPYTADMLGIVIDTAAVRVTLDTYRNAHPREAGVCYYGEVRDSTIAKGHPEPGFFTVRYIYIPVAEPALIEHATDSSVSFLAPPGYVQGCRRAKNLVGVGHNHPSGLGCTHSDLDALFLFKRHDLLFSFVLCATGRGEVLWQDGRRHYYVGGN